MLSQILSPSRYKRRGQLVSRNTRSAAAHAWFSRFNAKGVSMPCGCCEASSASRSDLCGLAGVTSATQRCGRSASAAGAGPPLFGLDGDEQDGGEVAPGPGRRGCAGATSPIKLHPGPETGRWAGKSSGGPVQNDSSVPPDAALTGRTERALGVRGGVTVRIGVVPRATVSAGLRLVPRSEEYSSVCG